MLGYPLLLAATLLVAFSNGANDNFKGVATLYGSRSASYARALAWATLTTLGGALASSLLARGLILRFSGKGLVPDALVADPSFLSAVAVAAALSVLAATWLGMPVSTTHALVGGLVGAGLARAGSDVAVAKLVQSFLLPLLLSPLLAALAAALLYTAFHRLRIRLGIDRESCLCASLAAPELKPAAALEIGSFRLPLVRAGSGTMHECAERYGPSRVALHAQRLLSGAHWLTSGALGFARGLNDAPKIAALAIAFGAGSMLGVVLVALAMAAGSLRARRVAQTVGRRITPLNQGQGFSASCVASLLVLLASHLALPVSTTHVSVGALFGIGGVSRRARPGTVVSILGAWVTTLPFAALLGALAAVALA